MTINVNNYEAERRLSWLLKQVATGERVVIWRDGHPIADLAKCETGRAGATSPSD